MAKQGPFEGFLRLVDLVHAGQTARSENDLSSKLIQALEAGLGLHAVLDTRVASASLKRPDILAYAELAHADLALPADIIIEAKKPEEIAGFATLGDAIVSDDFWAYKTLPYLTDNLPKVKYFAASTFDRFVVFPVATQVRRAVAQLVAGDESIEAQLRAHIRRDCIHFNLTHDLEPGHPESVENWLTWVREHLHATKLVPPSINEVLNLKRVDGQPDLEDFATKLAQFAAGATDEAVYESGLFVSVRRQLLDDYRQLSGGIVRDLHIYLMSVNPGVTLANVARIAEHDTARHLDDFVAASIHSLISRLFAFKAIEDAFGHSKNAVLERELWIFDCGAYEDLDNDELKRLVFSRLEELRHSKNGVIRGLASYGSFFNWVKELVDSRLFRSLFEMFASHNFEAIQGDLLGRFFELYSQRVNSTRRRELGQYYTPLEVVEFMWKVAADAAEAAGSFNDIVVLDPGMGSGTFLSKGAEVLAEKVGDGFWNRLVGFDVSAAVLGIAHVNVYMAILAQLPSSRALEVADLKLFSTDSLDPRNGEYLKQILPLMSDDAHRDFIQQRVAISSKLKQGGAYHLVIGNPPYRNNSHLTLKQVAARFPRLLRRSALEARAQQRNIRDDYAWFFAAADYYINERGLIAFIASDSFASHLSYRFFREELLRNYKILVLVRLGTHIFRDVGPRISFAIVIMERRPSPIADPTNADPIPVVDLRPLASGADHVLGTSEDPRLVALRQYARARAGLPKASTHSATGANKFALYPQFTVAARVAAVGTPLHAKKGASLFVAKWPGLITAFDKLFRADKAGELKNRMESFVKVCSTKTPTKTSFLRAVNVWADEHNFEDEDRERLLEIAEQVRQLGLAFDAAKIKRTLAGALPNSNRWYPSAEATCAIYYEPRLHVSRKKHEGKFEGWGTMEQWRDPESHKILPKLVYTTASKVNYGLKAFVLHDEWFIKLHGGTSQQYHYTGLENPLEPPSSTGLPNNLGEAGVRLALSITDEGGQVEDLLFYVAALYNSDLAASFLEEVGSASPLQIVVPSARQATKRVLDAARYGRELRNLFWLHSLIDENVQSADRLEKVMPEMALQALGLEKHASRSKRFKASSSYHVGESFYSKFVARITELDELVNAVAGELYGDGWVQF